MSFQHLLFSEETDKSIFDCASGLILNNLFKYTQLQDSYGVIMLALVNGIPKVLNLKEMFLEVCTYKKKMLNLNLCL